MVLFNSLLDLKKWGWTFIAGGLLLTSPLSSASGTDPSGDKSVPWSRGEVIKGTTGVLGSDYYRKFLEVTPEGYFIVQEFYNPARGNKRKGELKRTDPFVVETMSNARGWQSNEVYKKQNCNKDRVYIEWAETGEKYQQASCEANNVQLWVMWHPNGQKRSEVRYKEGKTQGLVITRHPNGQKASEAYYEEDKQQGILITWHDNGQKSREESADKSRYTTWYENGQMSLDRNINRDKSTSITRYWYENGVKSSEIFHGDNNPYEMTWYKNGVKESMTVLKKSESGLFKKDGLTTYWYENGQKKSEEMYRGHKKEGMWLRWYENGAKKSEGNYKNDLMSGKWSTWYANGKKESQGAYKWGLRHGIWLDYDQAGNEKTSKENAYITAPIVIGIGAASRGM